MTKLLLKASAQIELTSKKCSMAPLLLAADFCHQEVRDPSRFQCTKTIKLLLENHCNKDVQYHNDSSDSSGATALIFAVQCGNIEVVKVLLDYEIDINAQDKNGYTALFYAVKKSNLEILTLLLKDERIDKNVRDFHGENIFDHARKINHPDIIAVLGINFEKRLRIFTQKNCKILELKLLANFAVLLIGGYFLILLLYRVDHLFTSKFNRLFCIQR